MAKPYKEGSGWAFRVRLAGQDIYRSGFESKAAADKAQRVLRAELDNKDRASGRGPFQTSVATAFTQYARQRLPYLKGAPQDARIINRYLRALQLPEIHLIPVETSNATKPENKYFEVSFVAPNSRAIPNSLVKHRSAQALRAQKADEIRRKIAAMPMANVTADAVQELINAMREASYKAAPIRNERAELRRLFNHAKKRWNWSRPHRNPASDVDVPPPDKPRDSVLTNEQWENLSIALCQAGNEYAPYLFCLMLETAMRSCEPLTQARWCHIDWSRRILRLPDAKSGARDVPLSPGAIEILRHLQVQAKSKKGTTWSEEEQIFPTTYEAVKKAWAVARKICNEGDTPIGGLRMHDLRHTAATRYALQFNGNMPIIMQITGHTTTDTAMRYINIKADHVADMLHGSERDIAHCPAGYKTSTVETLARAQAVKTEAPGPSNVVALRPATHLNLPLRATSPMHARSTA